MWRKIIAPLALVVLAGGISGAAAEGQTRPSEHVWSHVTVDLPFEPEIPAKDEAALRRVMLAMNERPQLNSSWIETAVRKELEAHRTEIAAKDATYLENMNARVKELSAEMEKLISAKMAKGLETKLGETYDEIMETMKGKLAADRPKLTLASDFHYERGHFNPGVPGWSTPTVHLQANGPTAEVRVLLVETEVEVRAAGVPLKIKVTGTGALSLAVFYEGGNANAFELSMPETPVSAVPSLTLKEAFMIQGEGVTRWGNALTYGVSLPRVKGRMRAQEK